MIAFHAQTVMQLRCARKSRVSQEQPKKTFHTMIFWVSQYMVKNQSQLKLLDSNGLVTWSILPSIPKNQSPNFHANGSISPNTKQIVVFFLSL